MDTEQLTSFSDDEMEGGNEGGAELPKPLQGPSLDEAAGWGVELHVSHDDNVDIGVDFREQTSLPPNARLDTLKEHVLRSTKESASKLEATERKLVNADEEGHHFDPSVHHTDVVIVDEVTGIQTRHGVSENQRPGSINTKQDNPCPPSVQDESSSWRPPVPPDPVLTGIAPPLSEGKKYHVFFSYELADRDWVDMVRQKLEAPEFGFRCSVHERDFHGGKRVIENITEHIRISEKTVMVLTPDFTQSRWCMFEVEQGMVLSLEERQLLVIPVLVKDCPIPDSIKTLTYIDASSGNEWWQRFIDAILSREEVVSFSGTREVAIQPRYRNMDVLATLSSDWRCPMGEELRVSYIPEALLAPGVQMTAQDFDQVTAKMKTAAKLSLYCCNTTPCCAFTFVMLLQMLIAAVISMFFQPDDNVTMLASSILLLLVTVTIFFGQRIWRTHRLKQAVVAVNNGLIENNVLVGFKAAWSTGATFRLRLTFWFFDMLECRDQAMDLLCRSSEAYTTAYQRGHLKVKDDVRHVRHALCMCQFVEQEHVGKLTAIPPEVV
ncbi:uncharacterized protein LOC125382163 isoform X2 [Haliotis rufescens]|uniref:uncharacterized protein LOC125382163 isoform X2 n=1 Tax=Haliotis rufescens TaxID=6454 RepID=UPI00201E765A|nr:uncharacterized protein LOC125382163 isoform X2 [Haliotis rufescens]